MYFQSLDDKRECVGVYKDGQLHFDNLPTDLHRTWKYSAALSSAEIEYGWLYCNGAALEEVCPESLKEDFQKCVRKMRAFQKSFELAKIDFRNHCFFDMVPHDFLVEFLEIKNQITKHTFETYERPPNYELLSRASEMLHEIAYQPINLNNEGCKEIFLNTSLRRSAQSLLNGSKYIDYNLFGTVTGRLTTRPGSLPILTMKKSLRKLVKPQNDWFLSLDYNGAEVRTLLSLSGEKQPTEDIHTWNLENVLERSDIPREEAKTIFFSWLYNAESDAINTNYYDRKKVLDKYFDGEYISTPMNRSIKVDQRRALNYLIQSTTADLVLDRAIALSDFLKDKKSYISHLIHDEIVIDLDNSERGIVADLKEIFANNQLDTFMVNLKCGKNWHDLENLNL